MRGAKCLNSTANALRSPATATDRTSSTHSSPVGITVQSRCADTSDRLAVPSAGRSRARCRQLSREVHRRCTQRGADWITPPAVIRFGTRAYKRTGAWSSMQREARGGVESGHRVDRKGHGARRGGARRHPPAVAPAPGRDRRRRHRARRRASEAFVASLRDAPLALLADKANEQHYELPPAFFAAVLGRHRSTAAAGGPKA